MEDLYHKIPFARVLRQDQTDVEQLLWKYLRNRRVNGVKFRRQHPVGPFIVDFVSVERNLVIELDGGQHTVPDKKKYDKEREAYLYKEGYRVMRFWNNEVLEDIDAVVGTIMEALTLPSPKERGEREEESV